MSRHSPALSGPSDSASWAAARTDGRRRRASWMLICAAVIALFAALAALNDTLARGPSGPANSSYSTDGAGLAAWSQLLSRSGHAVDQLRAPLASARLDPSDTVILLDPNALLHSDGERLLLFLRAGGRLVLGGGEPRSALLALSSTSPSWSATSSARNFALAADAPTSFGVREVISAGEGAWESWPGYRPIIGRSGGEALAIERRLGRGQLELLADASPLQNRLLASADNAQLSLDLVGPSSRPDVFVESVHGYGESSGLAAIPADWWLALAGLALAGLVWILARGRRLGPPERTVAPGPPPRSDYARALALLLQRTAPPGEIEAAFEHLRDRR